MVPVKYFSQFAEKTKLLRHRRMNYVYVVVTQAIDVVMSISLN